jgi:hypothetical protein
MKTSEYIHFDIQIYPYDSKDNKSSFFSTYFNDLLLIQYPFDSYNKMYQLFFKVDCLFFKKHQLSIIGNNDFKLKILKLTINSCLSFNNFEKPQLITYKKNDNSYIFEFESPCFYYFLNRL